MKKLQFEKKKKWAPKKPRFVLKEVRKIEQREWWYSQGKSHYHNPIICENKKKTKEFSLFKEQLKSNFMQI